MRIVYFVLLLMYSMNSFAQVGRERGNPRVPLFVSHIPRANQSILHRKKAPSHNIINKIICFEPKCRRVIGWQKGQKGLSLEEFKKEIQKNAKNGAYESYKVKGVPKQKKDTARLVRKPDSVMVIRVNPVIHDQMDTSALASPLIRRDSLIVLNENQVLFEVNQFVLRSKHQESLDSIVGLLNRYPELYVKVSGHTDNTGNELHNGKLSTQRAEAVADYLIEKGIDTIRVTFEGHGSLRPIASNETPEGRRKNRRVEVRIH